MIYQKCGCQQSQQADALLQQLLKKLYTPYDTTIT